GSFLLWGRKMQRSWQKVQIARRPSTPRMGKTVAIRGRCHRITALPSRSRTRGPPLQERSWTTPEGLAMKMLATLAVLCLPLLALGGDTAKGKKVDFEVYGGHFQKNNADLKGDASYLVFSDRAAFDKVFGVAATTKKQNFVP